MIDGIKIFLAVVAALCVLVAVNAAVFVALARAGHAHEYDVTGINTETGERIVGTMVDDAHNGTVYGVVLDRLERIPASGQWSGKGLAKMSGRGKTYKVEVVE